MKHPTVSLTGAFSYTGRYIAYELINNSVSFQAITNHPRPYLFPSHSIPVVPLQFEDASVLTDALKKTSILINTYWIRYPAAGISHETAVQNSKILLECAKRAGVQRVVHISVSNPDIHSSMSYFRGKAQVEELLVSSGLPDTIIRPTLIFGKEDVLIHNIAWLLKHYPFFLMPAPSKYSIQPIYAEEVGQIVFNSMVSDKNETLDAAGPETWTMKEIIQLIGKACGYPRPVLATSTSVTFAAVTLLNKLLHDTVITPEEMQGLLENRLISSFPPLGKVSFCKWLKEEGKELCSHYINDYRRFYGDNL